jgi:hypothetical protein
MTAFFVIFVSCFLASEIFTKMVENINIKEDLMDLLFRIKIDEEKLALLEDRCSSK